MWYKVKRIYQWTNLVRPAYEWKPDASRTLLYLPLESNATDYSGNSRTTSATSVTFTTVWWVPSAHVGTTGWIAVTPTTFITHSLQYKTTSCLIYCTDATSSNRRNVWEWKTQNACWIWCSIDPNAQTIQCLSQETAYYSVSWFVPNKWIHIVHTVWDWVQKVYINWELEYTDTYSTWYAWWNRPNNYQQSYTIMNSRYWPSNSWTALNWNAREIIFENILWSDEDVSKYYQRIKAKLWF